MKCEQYLELLSLYVDEELTNEEKKQLEKHLSECTHCQEELQVLYDIKSHLSHIEEAPVPEQFHTQLMERIHTEAGSSKKKNWIPYISSLAAVMIFAIVFINQNSSDDMLESMPQPEPFAITESSRARNVDIEAVSDTMPLSLEVEEWRVLVNNTELVESKLVAYADEEKYSLQITYLGDEKSILFPSEVDKQKLTEFLESLEEVIEIQTLPGQNSGLIVIITENTP